MVREQQKVKRNGPRCTGDRFKHNSQSADGELDMAILPLKTSGDSVGHWRDEFFPDSELRPMGAFEIPANLGRHIQRANFPDGGTPYGLRALDNEALRVARTPEGARNSTLWAAGCRIGELVSGGELVPAHAAKNLQDAALQSGLLDTEIHNVLFRPEGALMTGINYPRNRRGYLHERYAKTVLNPAGFNEHLDVWSSLGWWFDQLHNGAPSWRVLALATNIAELGILYRSNYLYFLNEIHQLVLHGEPGTKALYDGLVTEYRAQADEWELICEDDMGNLGAVVANNLPIEKQSTTVTIDYLKQFASAS